MLFLLDAVSASIAYVHYKIFEIDEGVFYAHTNTKWKEGKPPTDFYIAKVKWSWQTSPTISETILDELAVQLDHYFLSRHHDEQREAREKNH